LAFQFDIKTKIPDDYRSVWIDAFSGEVINNFQRKKMLPDTVGPIIMVGNITRTSGMLQALMIIRIFGFGWIGHF